MAAIDPRKLHGTPSHCPVCDTAIESLLIMAESTATEQHIRVQPCMHRVTVTGDNGDPYPWPNGYSLASAEPSNRARRTPEGEAR